MLALGSRVLVQGNAARRHAALLGPWKLLGDFGENLIHVNRLLRRSFFEHEPILISILLSILRRYSPLVSKIQLIACQGHNHVG